MNLSDFDYDLPEELIAQQPMAKRDESRLLVLDKLKGKIKHRRFYDILNYVKSGDVLVLNNSKVFPARLIGKKKKTGGKIEVFLLRSMLRNMLRSKKNKASPARTEVWQCLLGGRAKPRLEIEFGNGLAGELIENNNDGTWRVKFNMGEREMMEAVNEIGLTPLPPYIKTDNRLKTKDNKESYQTVYADDDKIGSVAAPTAGFHFTPELLKKIKDKGVLIEYITLHVGLGTFAPVKTEDIKEHKMHAEYVEILADTVQAIKKAKDNSKRIIAVGTTGVRTLEALADVTLSENNYKNDYGGEDCHSGGRSSIEFRGLQPDVSGINTAHRYPRDSIAAFAPLIPLQNDKGFAGWVNIFIYPGYKFKIVDAIITNFHLPKSTLLMLVSAFAGQEIVMDAYQEAIIKNYRFYSYGDAMLIK